LALKSMHRILQYEICDSPLENEEWSHTFLFTVWGNLVKYSLFNNSFIVNFAKLYKIHDETVGKTMSDPIHSPN
jgi:hypothetical protein